MAQPIPLEIPPRNPRAELRSRLEQAPEEHAEAVLAAYEVLQQLHERGVKEAYLYGEDAASQPGTGGLNAFFLLVDKPEVYGLPSDPKMPTRSLKSSSWFSVVGAVMVGLLGMISFRNRVVSRPESSDAPGPDGERR